MFSSSLVVLFVCFIVGIRVIIIIWSSTWCPWYMKIHSSNFLNNLGEIATFVMDIEIRFAPYFASVVVLNQERSDIRIAHQAKTKCLDTMIDVHTPAQFML